MQVTLSEFLLVFALVLIFVIIVFTLVYVQGLLKKVRLPCNDSIRGEFRPRKKYFPFVFDANREVCEKHNIELPFHLCAQLGTHFGYLYINEFKGTSGKAIVVFGYRDSPVHGVSSTRIVCFSNQSFTYQKSKCELDFTFTAEFSCFFSHMFIEVNPIVQISENTSLTMSFKMHIPPKCTGYTALNVPLALVNPATVSSSGVFDLNNSQKGRMVLYNMRKASFNYAYAFKDAIDDPERCHCFPLVKEYPDGCLDHESKCMERPCPGQGPFPDKTRRK